MNIIIFTLISLFNSPQDPCHISFPTAYPPFIIICLFRPVSAAHMGMDMGSSTGYVEPISGHIPQESDLLFPNIIICQ